MVNAKKSPPKKRACSTHHRAREGTTTRCVRHTNNARAVADQCHAPRTPPHGSTLYVPHTLVLVKQGARARSSHLPLEAEDGVIETEHLAVLAALLERVDLLTPLAKQRRQQLDHGARRVRQRLRRAARRRAPGMDVSWTRHSRGEGRLRRVGSTRRTCTPRPAGRGNMRAERGTASRAPQ